MGLMDKVKAQATQLAQKTQETARDSKAKFEAAQAKRRADALLRNLGAVCYAERTGRGTDDSQAQIAKLVADISAHEAENGISLAHEPPDQPSAGAPGEAFPQADSATGFPPADSATGFPQETSATGSPQEPGVSGFPPEAGSANG